MEDIFAIDDAEVDVVSRRQTYTSELPDDSFAFDEYDVPPAILASREEQSKPQSRGETEEEEFNFEYQPARTRVKTPEAFDLGLDEEVVVKRRAPQAKLDDERLLGPMGIPKIRDDLRKKIRFRGKGHELQDLGKFIELYQFWAHELFPKAKFRDAVKMIGKVGKSKSMKSKRRQIITDMLPRPEYLDGGNSEDSDLEVAPPQSKVVARPELARSITTNGTSERIEQEKQVEQEEDSGDEFMLSDFEDNFVHGKGSARPAQGEQGIANDIPEEMPMEEVDDVDDMDALEAMGLMA